MFTNFAIKLKPQTSIELSISGQLHCTRLLKGSTLDQLELIEQEVFYASQKLTQYGADEQTLALLEQCAQTKVRLTQVLEHYCCLEQLLLQYPLTLDLAESVVQRQQIWSEILAQVQAVRVLEESFS